MARFVEDDRFITRVSNGKRYDKFSRQYIAAFNAIQKERGWVWVLHSDICDRMDVMFPTLPLPPLPLPPLPPLPVPNVPLPPLPPPP